MSTSSIPLLLSLKPHYADLVFRGQKKVELRRRSLKQMQGRDVFVYSTTPVRMLRGGFRIGKVWTGTPEEIWPLVSDSVGVEKPEFDAYYAGRDLASALQVTDVWEYEHPVELSVLKGKLRKFVVPQSWRYVKPEERELFQNLRGKCKSREEDQAPIPTTAIRYAF
jgi:predicted transcriptional regulator